MKKITLSGCLSKLIFAILLLVGFVWGFSKLFPRAYDTLEAKALGINDADSSVMVTSIIEKDTIPKVDTLKTYKDASDFKRAVKLHTEGDSYIVPTKINGIPMRMLLDTGASNLSISMVEYLFFKRQNLVNDSTLKESECTIANGQTEKCYTTIISEVNVGGLVVNDVQCTVMERQDAPLLLGMNVLNKLSDEISIDYKRNLLILER